MILMFPWQLCSLCLEWNALGLIDSSFAVFCDGIAANSTLQNLDLRNNQVNHEGATELASCLKRNTALRALGWLISSLSPFSFLFFSLVPYIHYSIYVSLARVFTLCVKLPKSNIKLKTLALVDNCLRLTI